MAKFSVIISTYNSAETIDDACRSAQWADELIVVDSGSTDNTPEIVRRYTPHFVFEPWRGFTEQKKFAASLCRNDWVIVLDHDEEISDLMAKELQEIEDQDLESLDLLLCRRRNYHMGRPLRSWWPDWQSRVIHRNRVTWADDLINDYRIPSDPSRVKRLRGILEHRRTINPNFLEYFNGKEADSRIVLAASELHRRGRRCTWWALMARPISAFIKHYILKKAFLDGSFGLMIAQKAAIAVQLKYAALWAIDRGYLSPYNEKSDK